MREVVFIRKNYSQAKKLWFLLGQVGKIKKGFDFSFEVW